MNIAVTFLIQEGKILLLYKTIRGYYVAPGGKIEPDETTLEAAKREFHEETGLTIEPILASISTVSTRDETNALQSLYTMFTFIATEYQGVLVEESKEGRNHWYQLADIENLPMFQGDKILLNNMLERLAQMDEVTSCSWPLEYASFCYDTEYKELKSFQLLK